jgi:hypothetical protein
MKFQLGDRVRIHPYYALADKAVDGTVIYIDRGILHIKRDDGEIGAGIGKSWLVSADACVSGPQPGVTLLSDVKKAEPVKTEDEKHIAGLSPEVIDMEAFDSFMREL